MLRNGERRKQLAALLLGRDVQMRKKDVAALIGVHPNTISRWLREQAFRDLIEQEAQTELDTVRSLLDKAAFFAALKEMELLGSGNENVAARVAADILDRTGYAKALELTGMGGGPITLKVIRAVPRPDDDRDDTGHHEDIPADAEADRSA